MTYMTTVQPKEVKMTRLVLILVPIALNVAVLGTMAHTMHQYVSGVALIHLKKVILWGSALFAPPTSAGWFYKENI